MAELAPVKSVTDPPAPEQPRAHQRNAISRRLHASSFRSRGQYVPGDTQHSQHRHNGMGSTLRSAIELGPAITLDKVLRRNRKSAEHVREDGQDPTQVDGAGSILDQTEIAHRNVTSEQVVKAKEDNAKREEELRASLKVVEEVGMNSTRQLDDKYYSILEKASILRSTVTSLQQLAEECARIRTHFQEDSGELERETNNNISSFGNFDQQEKSIDDLVNRLKDSRDATGKLHDRLESARLRVEEYEKQENEFQSKRRARWRMIWAASLGILTLIVAILVIQHRGEVDEGLNTAGQRLVKVANMAEIMNVGSNSSGEDPYLEKLFDTL